MAAWHEPRGTKLGRGSWAFGLAFALYLAVALAFLGTILWKLWTANLAGLFS